MQSSHPHPWRDLRDGEPPPEFRAHVHRVIERAREEWMPHASSEDIVFLLAEGLTVGRIYPSIAPGTALTQNKLLNLEMRGVYLALGCHPRFARAAGFIPFPRLEDTFQFNVTKYFRWLERSLLPVYEEINGVWRDNSLRAQLIRRERDIIIEASLPKDPARNCWVFDRAVVDNVGGNERDARRREKLTPEVRGGFMQLLRDRKISVFELCEIRGGKLYFFRDALDPRLEELFGKGAPLKAKVGGLPLCSIDAPIAEGSSRTVGDNEPGRADGVEAADAVRALQELRDLRQRTAHHPPLDQLAEAVGARADLAATLAPLLRTLLDYLDRCPETALQAALVYEFGGRRAQGWPAWKREHVAAAYGVTARQVEHRQPDAQAILMRLGA